MIKKFPFQFQFFKYLYQDWQASIDIPDSFSLRLAHNSRGYIKLYHIAHGKVQSTSHKANYSSFAPMMYKLMTNPLLFPRD